MFSSLTLYFLSKADILNVSFKEKVDSITVIGALISLSIIFSSIILAIKLDLAIIHFFLKL